MTKCEGKCISCAYKHSRRVTKIVGVRSIKLMVHGCTALLNRDTLIEQSHDNKATD